MKFIAIIVSFLITSLIHAQKNDYEFIGAITTSSESIISYKLHFSVNKDGSIEGESTTDFYGSNITKSKVSGSINRAKTRISFSETQNISTKSEEDESIFCYIHTENLRIRTVKGKNVIQGHFEGKYPSGEDCEYGIIYLVSSSILEELNIDEDSIRKLDSIYTNMNKPQKEKKHLLRSNEELSVEWHSKFIEFEIWDAFREDGDMIDIYINDVLTKKHLLTKNEKQLIRSPIKDEQVTIRIVAVNEGKEGSNTVKYTFKDADVETNLTSSLKTGEEITIHINPKNEHKEPN